LEVSGFLRIFFYRPVEVSDAQLTVEAQNKRFFRRFQLMYPVLPV